MAEVLCGTRHTAWTEGCGAGVYNAARWQTTRERGSNPGTWLHSYDVALTGKSDDCGNGAAPENDGCRNGNAARASGKIPANVGK